MRIILFLFTLLFPSLLTLNAQTVNRIQPINLGVILLDEPSIEKMVETCQYYNLTKMDEEDGFRKFKYPSGVVVKFKIEILGNEKIPLIMVTTEDNAKNIKKILSELGFDKISGNRFFKGSKLANRYATCNIFVGNPSTVVFTKEKSAESI